MKHLLIALIFGSSLHATDVDLESELSKFTDSLKKANTVVEPLKDKLTHIKSLVAKAATLQSEIEDLEAQMQQPMMPMPMPMGRGGGGGGGGQPGGGGAGNTGSNGDGQMGKIETAAVELPESPQEITPASSTLPSVARNFGDAPMLRPDLSSMLNNNFVKDQNPYGVGNIASKGLQLGGNTSTPNTTGNTAPQSGALAAGGPAAGGMGGFGGGAGGGLGGGGNVGGDVPNPSSPYGDGGETSPGVLPLAVGSSSGGGESTSSGGGGISNDKYDVLAQRSLASAMPGKDADKGGVKPPSIFGIASEALNCREDKVKSKVGPCGTKRSPILLAMTEAEINRLLARPVSRGIASVGGEGLTIHWAPKEGAVKFGTLLDALRE